MGVAASQPLWLLGIPLAAAALLAVQRRWPPPLPRRRAWWAFAARLAAVSLLLLALAGARVTSSPHQRVLVAVVDLSASTQGAGEAEAAAVRRLAATRGPDDLFAVVTFGRTAEVEVPPTKNPVFDTFETRPDPGYTDIAGALELAAGVGPAGYGRQLVLVTDGRQNLGDAAAAVQALAAQGVRVDVLPAGVAPTAEEYVAGLDAPAQARAGQAVTVTAQVVSNVTAQGHLVVTLDGRLVSDTAVTLQPGATSLPYRLPGLGPGLHNVHASLTAGPDTYAQNDSGEAAILVVGRPRVLVLEGSPGAGANAATALRAGGTDVDVEPEALAPTDPAGLVKYQAVLLADTSADAFRPGAMQALAESVHELGHGLVAIGGPDSYGPGGWEHTPLEDALPVSMQIPPRKQKPKVAVVLVIESMESASGDATALAAAESVIAHLSPQDEVGVTDGRQGFVVPLTPASQAKSIDARLRQAVLGDPPSYLPYINMAGAALAAAKDAPLKHIVMLGDGDAQDTGYQAAVGGLHAQGITTSTIYIPDEMNFPGAVTVMEDIARWGGGRFYSGTNPKDVPQLLLQESRVALKPWFEQFDFFPRVSGSGDLLGGVPLTAFPQLGGYVVTTPKPASEVYFSSPKDDPVLAAWQYGLGRSVAWTSDLQGRWTAGFLRSPVAGDLVARMVDWALPGAASGALTASIAVAGTALDISVAGPAGDTGVLQATVVAPDLTSSVTSLALVAPGRWRGSVPAGAAGTYAIHLALLHGGTPAASIEIAAVVPYPAEYRELGVDTGFTRLLARLGGGEVLAAARPGAAWSLPVPALAVSSAIFWALLLVVVVLWPLDVALRRLALTPRQALALAASLATLRRPRGVEIAVPAELVRLTDRVGAYRRVGRRRPAGASEPGAGAPLPTDAPPGAPAEAPSSTEAEGRSRRRRCPSNC